MSTNSTNSVQLEDLYRGVLSADTEEEISKFQVETFTDDDMDALLQSCYRRLPQRENDERVRLVSNVDVDYLMVMETCEILFSKPVMNNIFGDLACAFFKKPFKETIYSAKIKQVLTIGRIGEYKLSVISSSRYANSEATEEENMISLNEMDSDQINVSDSNEDSDIDSDNESNLDSTNVLPTNSAIGITNQTNEQEIEDDPLFPADSNSTKSGSMLYKSIKNILQHIHNSENPKPSFQELTMVLKQYFQNTVIVIWRYGQKVPYVDLKIKLVSLLQEAQIPIEIAFGVEYKLVDYFVAAKVTDSTRSFAFSNFMSNECCNLRIHNANIAKSYLKNSYRVCLYNTLQHSKKEISFLLKKDSDVKVATLAAFDPSIRNVCRSIRDLEDKIPDCKLRLEFYVQIHNIKELGETTREIPRLINEFVLCKKPNDQIIRHMNETKRCLRFLYRASKQWSAIECLPFLMFYSIFISYINSNIQLTRSFSETNYGMFLPEHWVDVARHTLTRYFFEETSVVEIWESFAAIFGNTNNGKIVGAYYYFHYYKQFQSYIGPEDIFINKIVEYLSDALSYLSCSEIPNKKHTAQQVFMEDVLRVLLKKHTQSYFLRELIQLIFENDTVNSTMVTKLVQRLITMGFKVYYDTVLYSLIDLPKNGSLDQQIPWGNIKDFVNNNEYETIAALFRSKDQRILIANETLIRYCDNLYQAYLLEHIKCESHFYKHHFVNVQRKFSVVFGVFLNLLFMTYALRPNKKKSEFKKIIDQFKNFHDFSRFVYAAGFKYAAITLNPPTTLKKFMENKGVGKLWGKKKGEYSLTFNRILYFSGLFDRKHGEAGIYLPLGDHLCLKSRKGKLPHKHIPLKGYFHYNQNLYADQSKANPQSDRHKLSELHDTEDEIEDEKVNFNGQKLLQMDVSTESQCFKKKENSINQNSSISSKITNIRHAIDEQSGSKRQKLIASQNVNEKVHHPENISIDVSTNLHTESISNNSTPTGIVNNEIETDFSELKSVLSKIFPDTTQESLITRIIASRTTLKLLKESNVDDINEYLSIFGKLSKIISYSSACLIRDFFDNK